VVYVARNPKDVIVSYFHHSRLVNSIPFQGDLDKFAEYFMNDECTIDYFIDFSDMLLIEDFNNFSVLLSIFCSYFGGLVPKRSPERFLPFLRRYEESRLLFQSLISKILLRLLIILSLNVEPALPDWKSVHLFGQNPVRGTAADANKTLAICQHVQKWSC